MPIDYRDYPPDWRERRQRILIRAGHCCQHCEVPNYALIYRLKRGRPEWELFPEGHWGDEFAKLYKPVKVILTIAHLDRDPENWEVSDERLAALCQHCHLNYDRGHNVDSFKYGRNFRKQQLRLFNHNLKYQDGND